MHKIASAAIAATLAGVMALPAATPANAASVNVQFGQQERFVGDYCDRHPNRKGCKDFRLNHRHWGKNEYRRWYDWNRPSLGSLGAGIFGFAVGAAIASSVNNDRGGYDAGYNSHVARCEAKYRSYNAETDMYLGFDGDYHRCRL